MPQVEKLFFLSVAFACASGAQAASIHVVNQGVSGHLGVTGAITSLTALGHSVSAGGTLSDYSAFDQVWDLRYNVNFTLDDLTAYSAYLSSGGRIYLTGENVTFDALRNTSLRGLIFALGAGDVSYGGGVPPNTQTFTAAGAALNTPNVLPSVGYLGARQVTGGGSGFLVTESPATLGSMVAWDFGQINGAPLSRMIAVWDVDIFRPQVNGVEVVENLVHFLDGAPPSGVPEPASVVLSVCSLALIMIAAWWRKRQFAFGKVFLEPQDDVSHFKQRVARGHGDSRLAGSSQYDSLAASKGSC